MSSIRGRQRCARSFSSNQWVGIWDVTKSERRKNGLKEKEELCMNAVEVRDGVLVRPLNYEDAAAMHELIVRNRDHLDRWLRWSSSLQTAEDVAALIDMFQAKNASGDGFHCLVLVDGQPAGRRDV